MLQPVADPLAFNGARSALPPGREAVDVFVRSYQTLLRSTGEVRVAGLLGDCDDLGRDAGGPR